MKAEDIINIIQKHSLTVRCLPYKVISYTTYREGDEKWVNKSEKNLEIITQFFDLDYFKNKPPQKYDRRTPEQRHQAFVKVFPNGRKLIKEIRIIDKGGWWYVKETKDTSSNVIFNRKYDKFLAPTLEEAIQFYLDSL
jgi:hypothetical protein